MLKFCEFCEFCDGGVLIPVILGSETSGEGTKESDGVFGNNCHGATGELPQGQRGAGGDSQSGTKLLSR